jgi:hypothetical protein
MLVLVPFLTLFFQVFLIFRVGSTLGFDLKKMGYGFVLRIGLADDLNGSVGSIADLILKGPGFESQISHGFSLM